MTYAVVLFAGIVGAVAGAFGGTAVGMLLAPGLGISDAEGASGYFAVLVGGTTGGVAGLVAGVWLALRLRGRRGAAAVAGHGALTVGVLIALAGIAVGYLMLSNDALNPNGAAPQLAFELRLPPGATATSPQARVAVELHTDKNRMPGVLFADRAHEDQGRLIIPGAVEMYFRTSSRILVLKRPGEPDRLFKVKLPASARHGRDLGAWQRIDWVAGADDTRARAPEPGDGYEVRYRARWAGED